MYQTIYFYTTESQEWDCMVELYMHVKFLIEIMNCLFPFPPVMSESALALLPSAKNRCYYTFIFATLMGIIMAILISISLPTGGRLNILSYLFFCQLLIHIPNPFCYWVDCLYLTNCKGAFHIV